MRLKIRIVSLLFLLIIISFPGSSDSFPEPAQNNPALYDMTVGKTLKYRAYYKLGFLWVYAGNVSFSVSDTIYNRQPALKLVSRGNSLDKYNWIYKVDDNFLSISHRDKLIPLYFERRNHEGKDFSHNIYRFDYDAAKIFTDTENQDQSQKRDTLDLLAGSYDVLSAIYYCRSLDFKDMSPGEKQPVRMIIDNIIYDLHINYHGIETIRTRKKKEYTCYHFSVRLVKGTLFKGGEDLLVWLSCDERKIPIMVKSEVAVGSVNAYFWEDN